MKLLTLNIWGGHVHDPLLAFIRARQDTDIICLQEVYRNAPYKISTDDQPVYLHIFEEIQALLPNHQGFFRPVVDNIYGIAAFVKNTIDVIAEGEVCIHENSNYVGKGPTHSRNLQWLECRHQNKSYFIINVHGLWNGKGKTDSAERIKQSERIQQFVTSLNTPVVICGDFNLRPDTESIKILEQGMNNLIKAHTIQSTRTPLYNKEEKFADYVFTSPDINVHQFTVLADVVSDHTPILVEFT